MNETSMIATLVRVAIVANHAIYNYGEGSTVTSDGYWSICYCCLRKTLFALLHMFNLNVSDFLSSFFMWIICGWFWIFIAYSLVARGWFRALLAAGGTGTAWIWNPTVSSPPRMPTEKQILLSRLLCLDLRTILARSHLRSGNWSPLAGVAIPPANMVR